MVYELIFGLCYEGGVVFVFGSDGKCVGGRCLVFCVGGIRVMGVCWFIVGVGVFFFS